MSELITLIKNGSNELNISTNLNETTFNGQTIYSQDVLRLIKNICVLIKYVNAILMHSTVIFGVLTNILCIIVFAKPNFKKTNMGVFYINISVWNIIFLIFYLLVIDSQHTFNFNVSLIDEIVCKFSIFLKRVIREMPPWIDTYITLDRYLSICHPHKLKKIRNKEYITPTCLGLFVFLSLISIENFWYNIKDHINPVDSGISTAEIGFEPYINETNQTFISKCTVDAINAIFCDLVSILFRSIIPELVICIFSLLIVRAVKKSKNKIASKKSSTSVGGNKKKVIKSREQNFTKTVINMNIILLILNTPVTVMMILINILSFDKNIIDDAILGNLYLITYNISNFYYSLRFVFNLVFNKLFQDEICLMFHFKKSSKFGSNSSKTRAENSLRGPFSTVR
jgi:hypothetical protein